MLASSNTKIANGIICHGNATKFVMAIFDYK